MPGAGRAIPEVTALSWRMSGLGALTMAWIAVEAAMPLDWKVDGLMTTWVYDAFRDSVPEMPESSSPGVAMASHQSSADAGPMWAIGEGGFPEQALNRLADKLREIRGSANGG